jgi:dipeptidyl-peptidase 4
MRRLPLLLLLAFSIVAASAAAIASPAESRPESAWDDRSPAVPAFVFVGWLDDDHWLEARAGRLMTVDALTGRTEPAPSTILLAQTEMVQRAQAIAAAQSAPAPYSYVDGLLYPGFRTAGPAQGKQKIKGPDQISKTSPDGKWTAVVRKNDLYAIEKDTKNQTRFTTDGNDVIFNGYPDWVYWEEVYDRKPQGPWWSPDSTQIAFLRVDDTRVARFVILDNTQREQKPEITYYPIAGATNPTVKLGIARLADGGVTWIDLGDYPEDDLIVTRVGWLPDSKQVYLFAQNRIQTWLDVCVAPAAGGKPTKLFRDQTPAWVENLGPLTFLPDGSFLYFSEKTGYKHLYRYSPKGELIGAVTSGDWVVRSLDRVDKDGDWIYFSGTRDGWLGKQAYKVKFDGTGLEKLTKDKGTHEVEFSPNAKYFVDTWSSFDTDPQTALFRTDGSQVRFLERGPSAQGKKQGKGPAAKLVEIPTPDGFSLAGTVLLPPNHDPAKKYPVWFQTYGGPQLPTVTDKAGAGGGDGPLAAMGFIVFRADPRSASARGAITCWPIYKKMGVEELKDIETAIRWLIENYPSVDPNRIGMSGHSFGGYITAYAMTHSKLFAAGIAGAPPTDWRSYDSIYTERYMSTPMDNPEGYKVTSVVEAASDLHGRLLILHGMMDDNVHMQNTVQLMDALQKANKDFEVMFYPHARHGIGGAHYNRIQTDFMKRALQP